MICCFDRQPVTQINMRVPGFEHVVEVLVGSSFDAASDEVATFCNVLLYVDCRDDSYEPKPTVYGRNHDLGCQPDVFRFGVGHWRRIHYEHQHLIKEIRCAWQRGGAVHFFDSTGEVLAPAGCALIVGKLCSLRVQDVLEVLKTSRCIWTGFQSHFIEGWQPVEASVAHLVRNLHTFEEHHIRPKFCSGGAVPARPVKRGVSVSPSRCSDPPQSGREKTAREDAEPQRRAAEYRADVEGFKRHIELLADSSTQPVAFVKDLRLPDVERDTYSTRSQLQDGIWKCTEDQSLPQVTLPWTRSGSLRVEPLPCPYTDVRERPAAASSPPVADAAAPITQVAAPNSSTDSEDAERWGNQSSPPASPRLQEAADSWHPIARVTTVTAVSPAPSPTPTDTWRQETLRDISNIRLISPQLRAFVQWFGGFAIRHEGRHAVHQIIEEMRQKTCLYTYDTLQEAVSLMNWQYGHVNVVTTGTQPPRHTILMTFCKAELQCLSKDEQLRMLQCLLDLGADLPMVDARGTNSVMMSAGSANTLVFNFFHTRADSLWTDYGFDWNHRNIDSRNILNLVDAKAGAATILQKLKDLARLGFLDVTAPSPAKPSSVRRGGDSSANRRAYKQPLPGTARYARYAAHWQKGRGVEGLHDAAVASPDAAYHGEGGQRAASSDSPQFQWQRRYSYTWAEAEAEQWTAPANRWFSDWCESRWSSHWWH